MLTVQSIETGYGKKQILFRTSLNVQEGEIVALIGPNGAGKSTVLKTVCGLLPVWAGDIYFNGEPIQETSPAQNVTRGITFAPQGSRVFHGLSVMDNLRIGGFQLLPKECKQRIEEVLSFFPVLRERLKEEAGNLSGGEQQMVALARALVPRPKLLMLDEPSLGLSPSLVNSVFRKVEEISKESRLSVLIVEQKVREVLQICQRIYSLKLGKVFFEGKPEDLSDAERLRSLFL